MQALNAPHHKGRFNFTTQFPYYKEVLYKPDFGSKKLGKPVVFDMDMSAGDFLALLYLLKVPVEVINLKVEWSFIFHVSLAPGFTFFYHYYLLVVTMFVYLLMLLKFVTMF